MNIDSSEEEVAAVNKHNFSNTGNVFHLPASSTDDSLVSDEISNKSSLFDFPITDVYRIIQESYQMSSYLGYSAQAALIALYSMLIFFGILGNILVAFVIGRKAELRTSRNLYIINLTISDVSMCLVCMPFTLVGLLRKNWTLGNFICKLIPFLQCTNILVSTATIAAIAADRYISIVWATRRVHSRNYVPWSVAVIWIVSVAYSTPLFAYYYESRVFIKDIFLFDRCVESWSSKVVKISWTITLLLIQYVIPILVLSFVHVNIKNFLKKNQTTQRDARKLQREMERNKRTTILLTSVALTFAISWFPWHVVNFLADFHFAGFRDPKYFYAVFGACHAVAMSTACSNPILYGWLNTNLKKELSHTFFHFFKQISCSKLSQGRPQERTTVVASSTTEQTRSQMEKLNPETATSVASSIAPANCVISSQHPSEDFPLIIKSSENSRPTKCIKSDVETRLNRDLMSKFKKMSPILAGKAFSSLSNLETMETNSLQSFRSLGIFSSKSDEEIRPNIYERKRSKSAISAQENAKKIFVDFDQSKNLNCKSFVRLKVVKKT